MQLKKQLRKQFNREKPCRWCGEEHATGTCPDRPRTRKHRRERDLEDYE